jgi:hypothetical protein
MYLEDVTIRNFRISENFKLRLIQADLISTVRDLTCRRDR